MKGIKLIIIYLQEIGQEIVQDIKNWAHRLITKKIASKDFEIYKWHSYTQIMVKWNRLRLWNKGIVTYLTKSGYKNIAIYGCGDLGKLCCDELLLSREVKVIEFIDRVADGFYKDIPIVRPTNISANVDAIIITPICSYLEIAESIYQLTPAKFISLEDMIAVIDAED